VANTNPLFAQNANELGRRRVQPGRRGQLSGDVANFTNAQQTLAASEAS